MNTMEWLSRAQRTLASAALLFDAGDLNGACNRAYYAMFDAARAALLASDATIESEVVKTHSGLITAFSLQLIKPGLIPAQHGKAFRQVDQIRLIADYSDADIEPDAAGAAVQKAGEFVAAIAEYLEST